jgi:hypothetical protein
VSYVTLSGPAMLKSGRESYMALVCVDAAPRYVCTVKRDNRGLSAPDTMYLHDGDRINIEDMAAMLKFVVALVRHGESIKLVNTDALTCAIALQVSMKSTNTELQELLSKLEIVMCASAPTGTGVNSVSFDKGMIKTFQPVSLAHATSISLVMSEF